jgi:hypothetical protein
VWSHLHNLLKASSPSKVEIQALLQDKDLVSKFSNDVRKYSHNYEGSLFFENYNFGTYDCVYMCVCLCVNKLTMKESTYRIFSNLIRTFFTVLEG